MPRSTKSAVGTISTKAETNPHTMDPELPHLRPNNRDLLNLLNLLDNKPICQCVTHK
jgi:hypothetical protein